MLTALHKRLVNGVEILAAAHAGYPSVRGIVRVWILDVQTGWVPAHAHLGIDIIGDVQVRIDSRNHSEVHAGHAGCLERVLEHDL